MKLIYVASPYAGDVEKNLIFAERACRFCMEQGHAFFAPHLLYPRLLNDSVPLERQAGLEMGTAVLSRCDELWSFGETVSFGMRMEIAEAERLGIPVRGVMEQKNSFIIGAARNAPQEDAPAFSMRMG